MNSKKLFKMIAVLVSAGAVIAAAAALWACLPWLWRFFFDPAAQQQLSGWLASFGPWTFFVIIALQVVQIVFVVLPGKPLEVAAGLLYGALGGIAVTYAGVLAGTVLVYYLSKRFGRPLVRRFISEETLDRYTALTHSPKFEPLVFLLFLIPGTPKDVLTYLAGLTDVKPVRYFLYSSLARVPTILFSTAAGGLIADGNFGLSVALILVVGALGAAGLVFHDKILSRFGGNENEPKKRP